MSLPDHVRLLAAYNTWADERILGSAARLEAADLYREVVPKLPPLRSILTHTLGTQVFWLSLWQGLKFKPPAPPDTPALSREYADVHRRLEEFAAGLTDEKLAAKQKWWATWGSDREMELGKTFAQVINHGTQHRSEAAVVLTVLDQSPGGLDLLDFLNPR